MLIVIGFVSTGTAVQCHGKCGFFTFLCILNSTSTERFAVCLRGNENCLAKCNKKAKERDANKDNAVNKDSKDSTDSKDSKDNRDTEELNKHLMPSGGRG